MKLSHKFVKNVPDKLEDGVVYISIEYSMVIHKCCCGCGKEVVTPLSPKDWELLFDGESISLFPSIGNWSFECRSHYWIKNNKVVWCKQRFNIGRLQDYLRKGWRLKLGVIKNFENKD